MNQTIDASEISAIIKSKIENYKVITLLTR